MQARQRSETGLGCKGKDLSPEKQAMKDSVLCDCILPSLLEERVEKSKQFGD